MDHLTKDFQLNFFDIRWSQILDIFHIIFLVLNIMNSIVYWVFTLWSSEQTTHCGTSPCTATKAIQSYMIEKKICRRLRMIWVHFCSSSHSYSNLSKQYLTQSRNCGLCYMPIYVCCHAFNMEGKKQAF